MNGQQGRVLIVNRVEHVGGVERIILTLAAGLDEYGWQPMLACSAGGDLADAARAQGTAVVSCDFDRMRITADPRILARYPAAWRQAGSEIELHCRELGVTVLHVHHPVTALYAARASRRLGIPIVLHVHETLPARLLYAVTMRLAIRRAEAVICVSGAALRLALRLGADPARSRVVYNGIDRSFLMPTALSQPAMLREAGPGPHIGVFGVLEPRKAQHVLLQAACQLAQEFPTAHFWLVGAAALKDKQAYVDRLHALASAPPLRGRVGFTDFQADVGPWICGMDIVVQTSVAFESFGMSVAEAMAYARPVVVTSVGGLPEVVRHEHTGLVVAPDDPTALANALRRLLADPLLRSRFGTEAANDVRIRFTPQVFCRLIAESYQSVKANGPRPS